MGGVTGSIPVPRTTFPIIDSSRALTLTRLALSANKRIVQGRKTPADGAPRSAERSWQLLQRPNGNQPARCSFEDTLKGEA